MTKVSPEAMAVLTRHSWPGNVRELENVIYRSAVIAQGDAILVKDLPIEIREAVGVVATEEVRANAPTTPPDTVPAAEKRMDGVDRGSSVNLGSGSGLCL